MGNTPVLRPVEQQRLLSGGSLSGSQWKFHSDKIADGELLAHGVARELAQFVAASHLAPGHKLPSESELARRFHVSVRIVREAFRMLAEYGIVRTSQGRRAEVSDLRPKAMRRFFELAGQIGFSALELLELRLAVEPRAASLAALRATREDLMAIDRAVQLMASAGGDVELFVSGDIGFHGAVVRATHNRFFTMIVDALADSLREERIEGVRGRIRQGRTSHRTLREHRAVAAAIAAQDPTLAERRMLDHLEQSLTYFWGYSHAQLRGRLPSKTRRHSSGRGS